ncbi:hyaluronan-binding protein 2 [Siniperca chuatsi]|uniref:hyaluronan-binding protein 2 n=1 Tax=Siniperca chuatsi TaxID=119488 RepID=UPI001CE16483|nr:hyaluronan-binding protein 2 [Siniperca chuatsi]
MTGDDLFAQCPPLTCKRSLMNRERETVDCLSKKQTIDLHWSHHGQGLHQHGLLHSFTLTTVCTHCIWTGLFLTVYEYYYNYPTESPAEDLDLTLDDWLYEILDITDECDPNPCLKGGVCDHATAGGFKCSCPEPYSGKKCKTGFFFSFQFKATMVKDVCKSVKCDHGSCVVTSTAPFYECKPPYKPPNCKKASSCRPQSLSEWRLLQKGSQMLLLPVFFTVLNRKTHFKINVHPLRKPHNTWLKGKCFFFPGQN